MIHDLKKQGLSISTIARKEGCDRKILRTYLERAWRRRSMVPRDRLLDPYEDYLRDRVLAFPDVSGARLLREIRDLGHKGRLYRGDRLLRDVDRRRGRG